MNHFKQILLLLIVVLFSGCANISPMAIDKNTQVLDVSEKSILLFSVTVRRHEASRYTTKPQLIRFEKTNSEGEKEVVGFRLDDEAGEAESDISNTFYVRTALAPGEYNLQTIIGQAFAFPFVGVFEMPILTKVSIPNNAVVYLGRVDALLRPRKDDEFRAGSVVPLIDQSVTGISGGTFDITIVDASKEDTPIFMQRFPILSGAEIQPMILDAWQREAADAWWQEK